MVRDRHASEAVIGPHGDLDRGLLGRVDEGVAHEIAHHLAQARVVPGDDDRSIGADADLALRGDDAGVGHSVVGDGAQVDRLLGQRPALVKAGQDEQVVDETGHSDRLLLDAPPRRLGVRGRFRRPTPQHLGITADGGERGSKLMRCVGDHPAQPRVRGSSLFESRFDLAQHSVEGESESPDLRLRRGRLHTSGQVTGGNVLSHCAHSL